MGTDAIIALILGLIDKAMAAGTLLRTVQAEGRNATPAEWQALMDADAAARQALVDAIAKARQP